MNTINDSNNSLSHAAPAGVHRGIWIGGGLMALTIVALATTLVVKGHDANTDTSTPLATSSAATMPADSNTTPASNSGTPPVNESSVAQAPVVVAQQPVYREPAPVVHHSRPQPAYNEPQRIASAQECASCGVIESYDTVQVQGANNGVGAVAGGVGGALVGSQIAGRGNHTLGGVLGAVGGGLLGNAIEKHERTVTEYDVHVRMNNGTTRTIRQGHAPAVGSHVEVDGQTLRSIPTQNYGSNSSSTAYPQG